MAHFLRTLRDSWLFQSFILVTILLASLEVGLRTYPEVMQAYGPLLDHLDMVILWIFVGEIAIKVGAEGRHPLRYFADGWNVFDFLIVVVCFLPVDSGFAKVFRLVRVLRVFRLITRVPRLQLIVRSLIKCFGSVGYIGLLLLIFIYSYAVIGVRLFGATDPQHFASLHQAMLTMFQVVTLEGWPELLKTQVQSGPQLLAVGYFSSFILLGTMIMLNLFIGLIVNSMHEAQAELQAQKMASLSSAPHGVADELSVSICFWPNCTRNSGRFAWRSKNDQLL